MGALSLSPRVTSSRERTHVARRTRAPLAVDGERTLPQAARGQQAQATPGDPAEESSLLCQRDVFSNRSSPSTILMSDFLPFGLAAVSISRKFP